MNAPTVQADHPFLKTMKPEHVDLLMSDASEAIFQPGQVVFRQGDPANCFYLILTGRVALETHSAGHGTVTIQTLGAGDVLGWSWLFAPFVWHFDARATEPTRVVVLNGARLLVQSNTDHEFGYELMKRISQIVIQRLQATRQQLLSHR